MNVTDKAVSSDITLGQLFDGLVTAPEAPLVFLYEGQPVKAGYHVTEVKAGAFSALDCGANPEAWSEMFIQLWATRTAGAICRRASSPPSSARFPITFGSIRRPN